MSIGPLNLNGAISRVQDISIIRQNEDQKPVIDQNNIHQQITKEVTTKQERVHDADDTGNHEKKYDAKEKGSGTYSNQGRQRKKESQKEQPVAPASTSVFDIKI